MVERSPRAVRRSELVEPGFGLVTARAAVAELKREVECLECRWYGLGADRDQRPKRGRE